MPRKKGFDPERALAKAMGVFWRLGYESASTETLMKAMGIARQSLYDTFGDKRALYLKALAFYRDETNGDMQRMLKAMRSSRSFCATTRRGWRRSSSRHCAALKRAGNSRARMTPKHWHTSSW